MIIDIHVHYGFLFFPIRNTGAQGIIRAMDRYRFDIGIISNIRGIFYDFRDCNRELKTAIHQYPERLKGYIVVNPNCPEESLCQLELYAKDPQFVGVKMHASWHNKPIDGPEYELIFEKCDEFDLPVLIHSYVVDDMGDQVSCPERIANVARRHGNPIIVAHMGGNSRRACKAVQGIDNLYMDISSGRERASQLYVWRLGRIDEAVAEIGADHILFGTDMPLLDPAICAGMMEDSYLTDEQREKILWKNAAKIFKLT